MEGPAVMRHELLALLRAGSGDAAQRVDRVLELLAEDLEMQVAFVTQFVDGHRVVTHAAPRGADVRVGDTVPGVPGGPNPLPAGAASHVSAPVTVEGETVGTLTCASTTRTPMLVPRDHATIHTVAVHVGELLAADRSAVARHDPGLAAVSAAVAGGGSLEELVRPLLELLQQVTDLESTYLTFVDRQAGRQLVALARNAGSLTIPEGLDVDWSDTLCRRSLDEGRPCVSDVPSVWPDSEAARALGLVTYVSVPVRDAGQELVGTLCGVSSRSVDVDGRHLQAMTLFARLIAEQLAREGAAARRPGSPPVRVQPVSRDRLTGLLDRRGVLRWLAEVLPGLTPDGGQLALALVDVGRTGVAARYGGAIGDEVLRRFAAGLASTVRLGDLHGRVGPDVFAVAAVLPAGSAPAWFGRVRRASYARLGEADVKGTVVAVPVTDPGLEPDAVLARAERELESALGRTAVPA